MNYIDHIHVCTIFFVSSDKNISNVKNTRGFQPLTIITKRSILDAAAVLDPPLNTHKKRSYASYYLTR